MSDLRPNSDPQFVREQYIKSLDSAANPTQKARELADDLFSLDLTVYNVFLIISHSHTPL